MKGDFTRFTFDPRKNFSRVLMQQGRVQLDADWNEMAEMQLNFLRTLAADLIGPHGGPGDGFKIEAAKDANNNDRPRDFSIHEGRYYVDGIQCASEGARLFSGQDGFTAEVFGDLGSNQPGTYLVYLDVWERFITYIEDEQEAGISIREVALRGPDTAARSQVVSQVKCLAREFSDQDRANLKDRNKGYDTFLKFLANAGVATLGAGKLLARAIKPPSGGDVACDIAPESRYRGAENQLYRVEIHKGGKLGEATFKWSRDNGSVVFAGAFAGTEATLEHLGRDGRFGLEPDGWVEIVDDDYVLQNRPALRNQPALLVQIERVVADDMKVILKSSIPANVGQTGKHPLLRRWDSPGEVKVEVPEKNNGWIPLEDGVEVKFQAAPNDVFRSGDYWLIQARVATGDVEWPGTRDNPLAAGPHGVEHHYAPLAIISLDAGGKVTADPKDDLRRRWTPLA